MLVKYGKHVSNQFRSIRFRKRFGEDFVWTSVWVNWKLLNRTEIIVLVGKSVKTTILISKLVWRYSELASKTSKVFVKFRIYWLHGLCYNDLIFTLTNYPFGRTWFEIFVCTVLEITWLAVGRFVPSIHYWKGLTHLYITAVLD